MCIVFGKMYSQQIVHTAETGEQTPLSNNTTDTAKQESELDSSEVYVAYKEGDVGSHCIFRCKRWKTTLGWYNVGK